MFSESDDEDFTDKLKEHFDQDVDNGRSFAIMSLISYKRKTKGTIQQLQNQNKMLEMEIQRIKRVYDEQRNMFYKELTLLRNYELYEERVYDHLIYQKKLMMDLARYKALTPDSYAFMNYTLDEIFMNVKIIQTDAEVIWKSMKNVFGKTFFLPQIQYEYSQFFSEQDKKVLDENIHSIKNEATKSLKNVVDKCEQDIKMLRFQINDKAIEINSLKAKHKNDIEAIKQSYTESGYKEAEQVFKEKEIILFQKFDADKVEIFKQLREAEQLNSNFNEIMKNKTLKSAVMRWRFLNQLKKMKSEKLFDLQAVEKLDQIINESDRK